jgi:hypothetical protein
MKLEKHEQMNNGLHWVFSNKNKDEISIICHEYSYGYEDGKFETMCSWLPDVQGHLSFFDVCKKLIILQIREYLYFFKNITKKEVKNESITRG